MHERLSRNSFRSRPNGVFNRPIAHPLHFAKMLLRQLLFSVLLRASLNYSFPVVSRSLSGTNTGKATFFFPGYYCGYLWKSTYVFRLGACGEQNTNSDLICAIGHDLFDSEPDGGNPNDSPFCGRKIEVSSGTTTRCWRLIWALRRGKCVCDCHG